MRAVKRERAIVDTVDRHCRVCNEVTPHSIEVSRPAHRWLGRSGGGDVLDLVERRWAHCTQCDFRFAEHVDQP